MDAITNKLSKEEFKNLALSYQAQKKVLKAKKLEREVTAYFVDLSDRINKYKRRR